MVFVGVGQLGVGDVAADAHGDGDADGDTDTATLTLTLNGADDGVSITDLTPAASGGEATVSEANLADVSIVG